MAIWRKVSQEYIVDWEYSVHYEGIPAIGAAGRVVETRKEALELIERLKANPDVTRIAPLRRRTIEEAE